MWIHSREAKVAEKQLDPDVEPELIDEDAQLVEEEPLALVEVDVVVVTDVVVELDADADKEEEI